MAKCDDCETPVVWLKKPDGGWLPPVEPLFDFAYNDHYTASVDGIALPVPQVYKKHECLSWEEKQLKLLEREREKQALIEADRIRRAEAERVQRELEEAREAQAEAERRLQEELDREERARRARQAARRREKEAERQLEYARALFARRLLSFVCRDCGAEANEPCRIEQWRTRSEPYTWWQKTGHNSRYADAPPDDRSKLVAVERWGEDYDPYGVKGSTPDTVGPWPPSVNDPGRYDMARFLRLHYIDVFEPEKRWLTDKERETLTDWLLENRELFKALGSSCAGCEDKPYLDHVHDELHIVNDYDGEAHGPGDMDQGSGDVGSEGVRRSDAERPRSEASAGGEVLPGEPAGAGDGGTEHED